MATYDAGIVTAYGAAVRGGYTGTYEQFCTQQANYAASAAAVEQAKEDVQELVDSIPADYSQMSEDVTQLKEDLSSMQTATASDVGKALKAKTVSGGKVTEWEFGAAGSGLSEDVKQALLQIAEKVAYIDADGRDYYNDLYDALYAVTAIRLDANSIMLTSIGSTQQLTATTTPAGGTVTWASSNTSIATVSNTGLVTSVGYGSCTVTASSGSVSATCAVAVSLVTLTSIAADYRQSGTVYDTASLDSLKNDLTVTATYSDQSTATVTEYTLSGTLTAGTSTITVSYGGKTATFNVTVTAAPTLTSISAVYTQSGTVYDTDTLDSLKSDLVVTAHMSDSTTQTVTNYVLSGTLTEGTSTITVSYGGKTTTFSVDVTASPEWGNDYTWLYKASDGQLLSARTDLVTASIGTGCAETLENGLLKLFVPQKTSQIIRFNLAQQSNAQGKLTAKVKFNSVGHTPTGTGFRLQISNGTNGTQIFERWDGTSTYTFGVYEGGVYSDKLAFELNTWHIISVERTSTGQVVSVDGVPILESASMSTNYCTKNSIITQNSSDSTVAFDADIAWITYKNND